MTELKDLKYIKKFCDTKNSKYLENISPFIFRYFYDQAKHMDNEISKIVKERYENPTLSKCIKVENLRKNGYDSLKTWMANSDNMYVGRPGRIFIVIVDPGLYKKVKKQNSDIIKQYHLSKFINKTKPAKLNTIFVEGYEQYGNIIIKVKKNGSFNLSETFHYKGSIFQNPYPVNKNTTVDESLEKYKKHIIKSGLVHKLENIRGHVLGCFCLQDNPCHAKVLINLLYEAEKSKHV
jgi:hypothetical protein